MARVLVIKPSSLGDIIHSAAAVDWIARSSPSTRVSWIVNEEYVSFVREFPGVHEALPFPRRRFRLRRFPLWIPEAGRFFRGLRRFDIAVDLQGLQRSALMARLSGAKERFGPRDARELGRLHYNRPVDVPAGLEHAIDRVLAIAEQVVKTSALLGADASSPPDLAGFRLAIPQLADVASRELVADDRPLIALCPGTRWESKMWPCRSWAELLRALADRYQEHRLVLLGAPDEGDLTRRIVEASGLQGESRVIDLAGRTDLWGTAAILARAECAATMDSAPLHLAAVVGTPTVSLFGPTDPGRVAPRGNAHTVLRNESLDCLGCYERRCPLEERICLPAIQPERFLDAIAARVT